MLKIKDNTIQKRLKGSWYYEEYNYLNSFNFVLKEDINLYDITFVIDNVLENENYTIYFDNCAYLSNGKVTTYEFDEKYSIDLTKHSTNYTLELLIKDFNNTDNIWELQYLANIYKKIINGISNLVEEVSND